MSKLPFEEVVRRHGPVVHRICRALLRNGADDAWSETFLAALRAYPGLPVEANVEAWLVRVAHNKAIDALRAEARRPRPTADVPEGGAPEPVGPAADAPGHDVWSAVSALPLRQREAVVYHHLAGRPYAEIAELTDSTPSAVRRAAADGIARLRRELTFPKGRQ